MKTYLSSGQTFSRSFGAIFFACLSLVLLVLREFSSQLRAQDPLELEQAAPQAAVDDWGLAITPYAWFAAQSSDVGGRELRQSFNDLASITKVGFQMKVLARWRWVVLTGDWTYADQSSGTRIARTSVDLGLLQHIVDMKAWGKVYDTRTPAQDGGVGIWVGIGARYWYNKVECVVTTEPVLPSGSTSVDTVETGQSWWDPVLGVSLHFPVTPRVGFLVRLTGGGLGIGNASDYLWDAEFAAVFAPFRRLLLVAGYRQFKYDRTDDDVKQTVSVVGPAIGLSIGIL